jgi:outer membrane receptor protein involved in Fe transport
VATEGAEWDSNTEYLYHNGGVTLRLAVFPEKLDADLGYLVEYGQEKTRAEGGAAVNLPRIHDTLQAAYATVSWHFTDRVTLRAGYRWEDYDIKNIRDDNVPSGLVAGGNLFLGDVINDYTANIFGISAVVEF